MKYIKTILGMLAVMTIAMLMSLATVSAEESYTVTFKDDNDQSITALNNREVGELIGVTTDLTISGKDPQNTYTWEIDRWGVDYGESESSSFIYHRTAADNPKREIFMGKDTGSATLKVHIIVTITAPPAEEGGEETVTTVDVTKELPINVISSYALKLTTGVQGGTDWTTSITSHVGEADIVTASLTHGESTDTINDFFIAWYEQGDTPTAYYARDNVTDPDTGTKDPRKAKITGLSVTEEGHPQVLAATAYRQVDGENVKLADCTPTVTVSGSRYNLTLSADKTYEGQTLPLVETEKSVVTATLTNTAGHELNQDIYLDLGISDRTVIGYLDDTYDPTTQTATTTIIGNKLGAGSASATANVTVTAKLYNTTIDTISLPVTVTPSEYRVELTTPQGPALPGQLELGTNADAKVRVVDKNGAVIPRFDNDWEIDWDAAPALDIAWSKEADRTATVTALERDIDSETGDPKPAVVVATAYNKDMNYNLTGTWSIEVTPSNLTLEILVNGESADVLSDLEVGEVASVGAVLKNGDTEVQNYSIAWEDSKDDAALFDKTNLTVTGIGNGTATIAATASISIEGIRDPIEVKSKDLGVTVSYPPLEAGSEAAPREKELSHARTFAFKPEKAGNYVFYSTDSETGADPKAGKVDGEIYHGDDYSGKHFWVCFEVDENDVKNNTVYYLPTSDSTGKKYKYKVGVKPGPQFFENYNAQSWTFAEPVTLGNEMHVDSAYDGLYKFVPTKTQSYAFYASGSGVGVSPRVRVLDANGKLIAPAITEDDRENALYYPSEIEFSGKANQIYYLQTVNSIGTAKYNAGVNNGSKETRDAAQALVNKANGYSKSTYTPASYNAMTAAKNNLQALVNDPKSTREQLQRAINDLNKAISNLKKKAANTLKVTKKNKKYKYATVRKKARKYKALKVTKAKGKVTYKIKYANKKSKKALKFYSKTGKVRIKKKTKKGTYKVTVTVKAAGNDYYRPATIKKTIKVKVK